MRGDRITITIAHHHPSPFIVVRRPCRHDDHRQIATDDIILFAALADLQYFCTCDEDARTQFMLSRFFFFLFFFLEIFEKNLLHSRSMNYLYCNKIIRISSEKLLFPFRLARLRSHWCSDWCGQLYTCTCNYCTYKYYCTCCTLHARVYVQKNQIWILQSMPYIFLGLFFDRS